MEQIDTTGTIGKALDILFYLHESSEPQGVTAIARGLVMPKSSVHRLLSALAQRELVEKDQRARYRPGIGLIALGLGRLTREPVAVAAKPVLEQQAAAVGETFFLVMAKAGRIVVLDKAEGSGFLRAAPKIGSNVPIHATAVGKLFLAFNPEALILPEDYLTPFTAHTLKDEKTFNHAVQSAREQGWASNDEEWLPGLSVIAAPISVSGSMLAAVALAMTTVRMAELGRTDLIQRVVAAAHGIEARLRGKTV